MRRVLPHMLVVVLISTAICTYDYYARLYDDACKVDAQEGDPCARLLAIVEIDAMGHKMFGFFVAFLLVFR